MTTSELVSYIRNQIQNNISKDLIISKLMGAGWHIEDIDEGFLNVELEFKPKVSEVKKIIDNTNVLKTNQEVTFADKYHEPLEGTNLFEAKIEPHKVEVSNIIEPKIETTEVENPTIEIHELDTDKVELPIVESIKIETPKVWVPMSMPIKEKAHIETIEIITQNLELQTKKEELIPTLMPKKPMMNSFGSINKDNIKKPDISVVGEDPSKNYLVKDLPKIAMLSSYRSDLLSVSQKAEETIKTKRSKLTKWFIVVLIVLILSLVTWVFASGYIKIKDINIPFIKKDPKVLLLNNSKILSSLKSYKTETNIKISSPSFANITYGLVSGEAVSSPDKDFISINTLGRINQNEKSLLSDNFIIIKSSLLQDYITTNIKNDGTDLFVLIPDLSQIIKENTPEISIVKINEQQFDLIPSLFSSNIESQLKKINIYKILSSEMPSYINNETLSAYNEFINKVEIIEKGQEDIRGVGTYHYSINADRQLAKKLLSKVSDNFVLNLSDSDKDRLTQILGSTTIGSFDVWVGKEDNNIYKYSVVLNIPLSKIIGFEDKSIGDNQINIAWETTYYDFNISNNIIMPDTSTTVTNFVNNIKEVKMKNEISAFKQLATNLLKVEGSFGKSSNLSGNCMNPSSGSLFSPTSHTKSATTAVSSISLLLNKILGTTVGVGSCYSTPKAWSLTIPISDNYDPSSITDLGYKYFFCIDNTGSTKNLITPPTGVVCK